MFLVLKKKKLVIVCMLAFFLVLVLGFFGKNNSKQTFFEAEGKTVIIDAGHVAQTQYYTIFKKNSLQMEKDVLKYFSYQNWGLGVTSILKTFFSVYGKY